MESDLLTFINRFINKVVLSSTCLGISLVGLCLVSVNYGLTQSVTSLEQADLLSLTLFSMGLGWLLGTRRLKIWQGLSLLWFTGVVIILIRVTNIITKLLVLVWLLGKSWAGFIDNPAYGFPYIDYIQRTWKYLAISIADTVNRISLWRTAINKGQTIVDLIPLTLIWGILLWIIFGWAGWSLRRKLDSIIILTPAMGLLAGVLCYVNDQPYGLIFVLGCVIFLAILIPQVQREEKWIRLGEDFSSEIRLDLALYAIPLALVILVVALIMPSLSIRQIADQIRKLTERRNDNSQTVVQSLGLYSQATSPASSSSSTSGLPDRHLVGAGPELSENVVMVVSTHEIAPMPPGHMSFIPNRYYWRGTIYDKYIGTGWVTSTTTEKKYDANIQLEDPDNGPPNHLVRQSVREIQDLGNIVYRAGALITADQPFTVSWRQKGDDFAVTVPTKTYTAVSIVPTITETELRAASTNYPAEIEQYYLQLPNTIPARVQKLAEDLALGQNTPYDKARSIERYLRTIPYNIKIGAPPADRDIVDYFLFDLKQGYCDYFATAMVILAREVGLPARLVIGYATGNYDSFDAQYVVTEADSHSWPEIYFPGYGWIEFEPTSNMSLYQYTAIDRPVELPLPTSTRASLQSSENLLSGWQIWAVIFSGILIISAIILLGIFRWRKIDPIFASGPERVIYRIFQSLYRLSSGFKTPLRSSDTPYEFTDHLITRLNRLEKSSFGKTNLTPAVQEIHWLAGLYSRTIYSTSAASKGDLKQARMVWGRLRTRLWLALILYHWD